MQNIKLTPAPTLGRKLDANGQPEGNGQWAVLTGQKSIYVPAQGMVMEPITDEAPVANTQDGGQVTWPEANTVVFLPGLNPLHVIETPEQIQALMQIASGQLTKRQQYAAAAISGILVSEQSLEKDQWCSTEGVAMRAFEIADAMLLREFAQAEEAREAAAANGGA